MGGGRYFFSYRAKLLFLLGGIGFIFVLGTTIFLEIRLKKIIRRQLAEKLLAIVSLAAEGINGDDHACLVSSDQETTSEYQKIKQYLQNIRQRFPEVKYIYTARIENNQLIFVVDADNVRAGEGKNSSDPAATMVHIGDVYEESLDKFPEIITAFQKGIACATANFVRDRWGIWLSAFAPIRTKSGQIDGVLCADMSVARVLAVVARSRRELLLFYWLLFFPGLLFASLLIGRHLFLPVQKLARAATAISFGDYSHQVRINSNDEMSYLGDVFNEMVSKIVQERTRLANELHDGPVQILASINWKLDLARKLLQEDQPGEARKHLDEIQQLLIKAIGDIRRSIYELYRQEISEKHFQEILRKYLNDFAAETGIKVESQIILAKDISPDLKVNLYRIIGEIFCNIRKHSRATWVKFNLQLTEDPTGKWSNLLLTVVDNGGGFDPAGIYPGHFGLKSIRSRAKILGGTVEIFSPEGSGETRIVLKVPLKNNTLRTKIVKSLLVRE